MCFTADLQHLQDHFSNFLLNFSSLAKNAKREIWRQKGDLHCKIYNCIKCLALPIFGHTPIIRSLSHWLVVCFLMLMTFTKFQWRFIQKLYRWCMLKRIIDVPNIFLHTRTGWRNVWVMPWKALKISLKSKLSHYLRCQDLLESIRLPVLPIYTIFLCYLTCTLHKMYSDMCKRKW